MAAVIAAGHVRASTAVPREVKRRDVELDRWCKRQHGLFREVDDSCQAHVPAILGRWPRFVDTRTAESSGDPFVIALILLHSPRVAVVTEQNGGSDSRPALPSVCDVFGIKQIKLLNRIQTYRWRF